MSQVALKMKRQGLNRQVAIEQRQAEIDEIERRKNLKNGLDNDDSRLGLREGTGMEEFQERVNRREQVYDNRAEKIKVDMEKRKEKMFGFQKELDQRVVKDNGQNGGKDLAKNKDQGSKGKKNKIKKCVTHNNEDENENSQNMKNDIPQKNRPFKQKEKGKGIKTEKKGQRNAQQVGRAKDIVRKVGESMEEASQDNFNLGKKNVVKTSGQVDVNNNEILDKKEVKLKS